MGWVDHMMNTWRNSKNVTRVMTLGKIYHNTFIHKHMVGHSVLQTHLGAQWLSGRVLDLRPRGRGFEPPSLCCGPWARHIYPSLVFHKHILNFCFFFVLKNVGIYLINLWFYFYCGMPTVNSEFNSKLEQKGLDMQHRPRSDCFFIWLLLLLIRVFPGCYSDKYLLLCEFQLL